MSGGYMKLQGGFPRCAMTFLTGGITTADLMDTKDLVNEVKLDQKFQYTYRSSYLMLAHCARLPPLSKSIGYAQSDTKRTKRRTTGNLLVNLLLS